MDPVSIVGLISTVGKCIPPFIACLQKISEYRQLDKSISDVLEKNIQYCERLELSLADLELIDESCISSGHKVFLRKTLEGFRAAIMTHRAEVDSWILRLGLSDKVDVDGLANNPQEIETQVPHEPSDESKDEITTNNSGCLGLQRQGLRRQFRAFSFKRRKEEKITTMGSGGNVLETVSSETSDKSASLSKHTVLKKLQYVVIEKRNVQQMTENLEFWDNRLSSGFITAIGSLVFKTSNPPEPPSRICIGDITHPIGRFVIQAKTRNAERRDVTKISVEDWQEHYHGSKVLRYIDDNSAKSSAQYQIFSGDAIPGRHPNKDEPSSAQCDPTASEKFPKFENCIFVDRGFWREATEEDTLRLARLFAGEEESTVQSTNRLFRPREDGDMLRCVAAVRVREKSVLVFQLPLGSARDPKTLRTILLDKRRNSEFGGYPLHPIADRAKLAVRLATAVLVIHSLGLVHKRINPETILMVESTSAAATPSQRFPRRLGFPYLTAFHTTRRDSDPTDCQDHTMDASRRAIYYHPRDQEARKKDKHRMLDDIFSLGVCLFEIALWRSLFVWDETNREYEHDDTFVQLSENCGRWEGMSRSERAEARTSELIRVAEDLIPGTMGPVYTRAVIACLKAGAEDSPFAGHPSLVGNPEPSSSMGEVVLADADDTQSDNESPKPVSISYLELVLQNLQAVHKGLSDLGN